MYRVGNHQHLTRYKLFTLIPSQVPAVLLHTTDTESFLCLCLQSGSFQPCIANNGKSLQHGLLKPLRLHAHG
nr:MAG TPA: hypothetical protein [Caudoviricetes sp.]